MFIIPVLTLCIVYIVLHYVGVAVGEYISKREVSDQAWQLDSCVHSDYMTLWVNDVTYEHAN